MSQAEPVGGPAWARALVAGEAGTHRGVVNIDGPAVYMRFRGLEGVVATGSNSIWSAPVSNCDQLHSNAHYSPTAQVSGLRTVRTILRMAQKRKVTLQISFEHCLIRYVSWAQGSTVRLESFHATPCRGVACAIDGVTAATFADDALRIWRGSEPAMVRSALRGVWTPRQRFSSSE